MGPKERPSRYRLKGRTVISLDTPKLDWTSCRAGVKTEEPKGLGRGQGTETCPLVEDADIPQEADGDRDRRVVEFLGRRPIPGIARVVGSVVVEQRRLLVVGRGRSRGVV